LNSATNPAFDPVSSSSVGGVPLVATRSGLGSRLIGVRAVTRSEQLNPFPLGRPDVEIGTSIQRFWDGKTPHNAWFSQSPNTMPSRTGLA
jgi:hypothetical protein